MRKPHSNMPATIFHCSDHLHCIISAPSGDPWSVEKGGSSRWGSAPHVPPAHRPSMSSALKGGRRATYGPFRVRSGGGAFGSSGFWCADSLDARCGLLTWLCHSQAQKYEGSKSWKILALGYLFIYFMLLISFLNPLFCMPKIFQ